MNQYIVILLIIAGSYFAVCILFSIFMIASFVAETVLIGRKIGYDFVLSSYDSNRVVRFAQSVVNFCADRQVEQDGEIEPEHRGAMAQTLLLYLTSPVIGFGYAILWKRFFVDVFWDFASAANTFIELRLRPSHGLHTAFQNVSRFPSLATLEAITPHIEHFTRRPWLQTRVAFLFL
jgi:hypothetical protein